MTPNVRRISVNPRPSPPPSSHRAPACALAPCPPRACPRERFVGIVDGGGGTKPGTKCARFGDA